MMKYRLYKYNSCISFPHNYISCLITIFHSFRTKFWFMTSSISFSLVLFPDNTQICGHFFFNEHQILTYNYIMKYKFYKYNSSISFLFSRITCVTTIFHGQYQILVHDCALTCRFWEIVKIKVFLAKIGYFWPKIDQNGQKYNFSYM